MGQTAVTKKCIIVDHIPNCYQGVLAHKEFDVTNDLKVVIDIEQQLIQMLPNERHPGACYYRIHIQEMKNGILRPYLGRQLTYTSTNRYKSQYTNVNFIAMTLSNAFDWNEPGLYQILLRVEFKEPLDATFHSIPYLEY